jgi:hypothetical protein
MLKYLYRPQSEAIISQQPLEFWTSGGSLLAHFLDPIEPRTLSQITNSYLLEYGRQCFPPDTTPSVYLSYLLCGLLEQGFVRVACPAYWPIGPRKSTAAFQLNPSAAARQRLETAAIWRTHGQMVGALLQTVSPLTLDDMDTACRERAQRDASFALHGHNKMTLASSLLALADHDLVQMILPREFRYTVTPLTYESMVLSPIDRGSPS